MGKQPIKRDEALKAFSREHHHGLLLCWKLKEGVKRNIETSRIKAYIDWFWASHLEEHFREEEEYIFSILPNDDALYQQAIKEHQELESLFKETNDLKSSFAAIEIKLASHIRFEERILFAKVQELANEEQMAHIANHKTDSFKDTWEDQFWIG